MYKKATVATDMLNSQCTASLTKNQRLLEQFRQQGGNVAVGSNVPAFRIGPGTTIETSTGRRRTQTDRS